MNRPAFPMSPMPYPQPQPDYQMPMYPQMPMINPYMQPQMPIYSLDEAIYGYVRFKESKGKDPKTTDDIQIALRTLSYVRPDIQYVHQITKRLILEYETLVAEIPANWRKSHGLRNLRFEELRRVAWDKPRLSPASVDKYSVTLRAFIHWCQDTDRMPNWKLPRFEGLDKRNAKDKRHPFTKEELHKFFASPQFTGHQPDFDTQLGRHKAGDLITKDHYYWIPWIGLYSGMRLREIIQLLLTDIRTEGEIAYFDINTDGPDKSLKNESSKRKVPIHPKLIEMGLLDYANSIREGGHTQLFPQAKTPAQGHQSDLFSKHFGRYLKAIGIKHNKLSFHSLRHTFIDQAARQARLPDHMIKALVGHADQTITFGTYGGGFQQPSLQKLKQALDLIKYKTKKEGHYCPSDPFNPLRRFP